MSRPKGANVGVDKIVSESAEAILAGVPDEHSREGLFVQSMKVPEDLLACSVASEIKPTIFCRGALPKAGRFSLPKLSPSEAGATGLATPLVNSDFR